MAEAAKRQPASGFVEAPVNYVVYTGTKPVTYIAQPGAEHTKRDAEFKEHVVAIHDGRANNDQLSLEHDGFVLTRHETAVSNFYDEEELQATYDREVEQLVKEFTGATRVVVFDHTIRTNAESKRVEEKAREPVRVAHNDYTEKSGPQRVRDLLPADEAEALLKRRFAVVQVWRPINTTVRQMPLAICNAQSIATGDLIASDLKYRDRTGEILQLAHNPDHRWFYFPNMERNEALVFKCYDSLKDGRSRFTAHTAFEDPTSPPDAPPRESIETRTLAFF
ncbi:MAG: methyltransferase [Alphaproteobacteria bacterium]|nr:methyltransferase [Alphaproteobacteria bacterium]